jgi:hypothetical protein
MNNNNNNFRPNNNDETNCWVDPRSEICEATVDNYLEAHGFKRYRVKDDGNCLFYTVELWIRLHNIEGLATNGRPLVNLTAKDIRLGAVNYGLENIHLISDLFVRNNGNGNNSSSAKHLKKVSNALKNMKSNKQWAGEGGDYMPLLLSYFTGLNLTIFNWSWDNPDSGSYIKIPIEVNPGASVINVLRINDNHYDLLIPTTNVSNKKNSNYNYFKKYYGKPVPKTRKNMTTVKSVKMNNGKLMATVSAQAVQPVQPTRRSTRRKP